MVIFLIGFMGAGKTSLGKQLAKLLGYRFADTDQLIEEQLQTTIADYFEKEGENAFRLFETKVLHQLVTEKNIVVATGGGLPCFNNNIDLMNRHGITIYIKQDVEELTARLMKQKNTRPLIKTIPDSSLSPYLKALLAKREGFYTQAKHTFSGPVISPQTVINTILLQC